MALGLIDDFAIFGGDYDTPDGSPIRDYVHVCDLADAHVRAVRYLLAGGTCELLNVGTGIGVSVFEVVAALERITGQHVPHKVTAKRAGDPPALVADPSKIEKILGFRAQHSAIETILQSAYDWHSKRHQSKFHV